MRFALFSHIAWPQWKEPRQVVEEITEEIQYGEELGFICAWHAEHHFTRYGMGSASIVLATSIAARTKNMRLGTAVLLPTLYHPIRLAEDTATLDMISGGRLDVGFGRGRDDGDYKAFGVDWNESQGRFQEAIDMVKGLWTTREFSFNGKYFQLDPSSLVPPPFQKPHPPIFIAATRTPDTMRYIVASDHSLVVGPILDTSDGVDQIGRFLDMCQEAGHEFDMSRIPVIRHCHVAKTDDEAQKNTRESMGWLQDVVRWRRTIAEGTDVYRDLEEWRRTRTIPPPDLESVYKDRAVIGSPELCISRIKDWQGIGIDYFGCNFAFGGLDHLEVMRTMEMFAKEVMPHFS